jgi:hypothetical protein
LAPIAVDAPARPASRRARVDEHVDVFAFWIAAPEPFVCNAASASVHFPDRRNVLWPAKHAFRGGSPVPSTSVAQSVKASLAAVIRRGLAMPLASAQTPDLRLRDLVNQASD